MPNIHKIKERRNLRTEILEHLYDLYFQPLTPNNHGISGTQKEIYGERNSEKHLAFHYLCTSGFIRISPKGDRLKISITEKGIDYVESIYEEN